MRWKTIQLSMPPRVANLSKLSQSSVPLKQTKAMDFFLLLFQGPPSSSFASTSSSALITGNPENMNPRHPPNQGGETWLALGPGSSCQLSWAGSRFEGWGMCTYANRTRILLWADWSGENPPARVVGDEEYKAEHKSKFRLLVACAVIYFMITSLFLEVFFLSFGGTNLGIFAFLNITFPTSDGYFTTSRKARVVIHWSGAFVRGLMFVYSN